MQNKVENIFNSDSTSAVVEDLARTIVVDSKPNQMPLTTSSFSLLSWRNTSEQRVDGVRGVVMVLAILKWQDEGEAWP